jgi:hypothetical protein
LVRILDLQLSKKDLALRLASALIFAGLILFVFYYLPLHIEAIASYFVPSRFLPEITSLASSFASSTLPALGLLLALLVFTETILRGTWAFGVLLIMIGSFWILYDLTLYREGLLFSGLVPSTINIGGGEQLLVSPSVQSELVFVFTGVIIMFIISSVFTIIRGARILWRKHRAYSRSSVTEQSVNSNVRSAYQGNS